SGAGVSCPRFVECALSGPALRTRLSRHLSQGIPMARTPSANGTVDASQLLSALRAVKKGDFTARLPGNQTGVAGAIAEAFNDIVELLQNTTGEFARIGNVVGKEGRIKQRASLGPVTGSWSAWIESINT